MTTFIYGFAILLGILLGDGAYRLIGLILRIEGLFKDLDAKMVHRAQTLIRVVLCLGSGILMAYYLHTGA